MVSNEFDMQGKGIILNPDPSPVDAPPTPLLDDLKGIATRPPTVIPSVTAPEEDPFFPLPLQRP